MERKAPAVVSLNPGRLAQTTVTKAGNDSTISIAAVLAECLKQFQMDVALHDSFLQQGEFDLTPRLVSFAENRDGSFISTTTIQVNHADVAPKGFFEFQNSRGRSLEESIQKAFDEWIRSDYIVLLDGMHPETKICKSSILNLNISDGTTEARRFIYGPLNWQKDEGKSSSKIDVSGHEVRPCCMFSFSKESFNEQISDGETHCVKMFATKEGRDVYAECRVDGIDFPPAQEALSKYAKTWPKTDFEMRKQTVIIQKYTPT